MPSFTIDFEVFCADCGAGLCKTSDTEYRNGKLSVNVGTCERCKEKAKDEGYKDGYNSGLEDGKIEGD